MKVPNLRVPRAILKCCLVLLSLLICAACIYSAYQWYEQRYIRPFSPQDVFFDGSSLNLPDDLAGPGPVRLVHIWDPSCPCNVGNQQHLAELVQRYAGQVEFYLLQKPSSQGSLAESLASLELLKALPGSQQIPSSPAVAVWDRNGQLAYFGPYSSGAICTSENSFIEPVLQAVLDNLPVRATHTQASGCFCAWPASPP